MINEYKKYIIALIVILFGSVILLFSIKGIKNVFNDDVKRNDGEIKEYEVLVFVRNQTNSNPEEDKKTSMKKGYVMGVYNKGHKWSASEKNSYLILKMKLSEKQKEKLTQSITKKRKNAKSDREIDEKEVVALRAYKINLNKIGFTDLKQLKSGQPFENSVFDWNVVEKVEK